MNNGKEQNKVGVTFAIAGGLAFAGLLSYCTQKDPQKAVEHVSVSIYQIK